MSSPAKTPSFLYGTAWKEQPAPLVTAAVKAGFRGIDTANQRRHYFESGVGDAVTSLLSSGELRREDLFLQTKFTLPAGQDERVTYDTSASPAIQVRQSFSSSLEHLRVDRVDSYLLHGLSEREGLGSVDREAWRALEQLQSAGATRYIGVCNISLRQLEELYSFATVKPAIVQNRCRAGSKWDFDIRSFCSAHSIMYQGFSLLTANRRVIIHPRIQAIASRLRKTSEQIVFAFALSVGIVPLTGTCNTAHMADDLAASATWLRPEESYAIENIASNPPSPPS